MSLIFFVSILIIHNLFGLSIGLGACNLCHDPQIKRFFAVHDLFPFDHSPEDTDNSAQNCLRKQIQEASDLTCTYPL